MTEVYIVTIQWQKDFKFINGLLHWMFYEEIYKKSFEISDEVIYVMVWNQYKIFSAILKFQFKIYFKLIVSIFSKSGNLFCKFIRLGSRFYNDSYK